MKRYLPNGRDFFPLHVDVMGQVASRRFMTAFIYLNTPAGGETVFPNLDISVAPEPGKLLAFPPIWLFPHAGLPPNPARNISSTLIFAIRCRRSPWGHDGRRQETKWFPCASIRVGAFLHAKAVAVPDSVDVRRCATAIPAIGRFSSRAGRVPERRLRRAAKEWRPLAEAGDPIAQFNLGLLYLDGHGVPQSPAEAANWFRRAAEQDYTRGPAQPGRHVRLRQGVKRDYVQAYKWLNICAAKGNGGCVTQRDLIAKKLKARPSSRRPAPGHGIQAAERSREAVAPSILPIRTWTPIPNPQSPVRP